MVLSLYEDKEKLLFEPLRTDHGGYVQNMAWPGMAWPLLACQILSFVLCKNVSRDAIETKTHEVLKLGVRK